MILCRDLSFSYPGGRRILSDINFHIEKGESVAILGSNGSGKSTLLRLIATLLDIGDGGITVDGIKARRERDRRIIRSKIAYVFQNPDSCFVNDIVIDDAVFTPINYGYSDADAKAMALLSLERFGILDKKDREIRTLSGGEKERAILSSISSMEKDIYIFDEVLAFLDEVAKETMLSLIADLKKEGKTILFVTQVSDEALYFDKTLLLNNGTISAFDNTEGVLRNSDLLIEAGVRLPKASQIAVDLEANGITLPYMPVRKEELCSLLKM